MAAMMTHQHTTEAMFDKPCRTIRALEPMAAMATQSERRITATIEVEEDLLAAFERLAHLTPQAGCHEFAGVPLCPCANRLWRYPASADRHGDPAGAHDDSGLFAHSRAIQSTALQTPTQSRLSRCGRAQPPYHARDNARRLLACMPSHVLHLQ